MDKTEKTHGEGRLSWRPDFVLNRPPFYFFRQLVRRLANGRIRPFRGMTIMIDEKFARLRTCRNNINRYHRLLKTELSELERQFIERRLNEEKSAMDSLANDSPKIHPPYAGRDSSGWKNAARALTVHDELAKFERKEIEFQKMERDQRATRLRLPIGKHYPPLSTSPSARS